MSTLHPAHRKHPAVGRGGKAKFDWKGFLKKPIVLVLLFSVAVHGLLLIGLGGVVLFRGKSLSFPFSTESVVSDPVPPPAPPMEEEIVPEEKTADPNMIDEVMSEEESPPPLEMMKVPGGASWAPAIPKDLKTSVTGSLGGSGSGSGAGSGSAKGVSRGGGLKLFGVEVKAKKLGVIVSINKSVQDSGILASIFSEIFKLFPDADVILTNGGGMMDWDVALSEFNTEVEEAKKREKETGKRVVMAHLKLDLPKILKFSSGEAMDWTPIKGFNLDKDYPGLKAGDPDLYSKLLKRNNTWFLSGYAAANATYKAFDELIKKKVEAIYWYNGFTFPVEGREAERLAGTILDNQIEIIVDDHMGGFKKGKEWIEKVKARTAARGTGS
jgi:hypothetical protein